MAKVIKAEDGSFVEEETGMIDTVVDGALAITKFGDSKSFYSGSTLAVAQGVGVAAGLYVGAKHPNLNPFA